MAEALGQRRWAVADGMIPSWSTGPEPEMTSHESLALLNTSGPYRTDVPARRTRHVRLNELRDPEPLPTGQDFSTVVASDVPIVVQHTRLDSRQAENALISTVAFPQPG
jgi:hypothetical protein